MDRLPSTDRRLRSACLQPLPTTHDQRNGNGTHLGTPLAEVIIPPVLVLAVKALLAPTFVVGASVAARRFGPWVGGVVGGLPVVAGPILLAYALEHGRGFAGQAAAGTLLGLLSLTAFVVVYGRLANRARWFVCMLCGWAAFALATVALDCVTMAAGVALGLVCAGFAVGLLLLPGQSYATAVTANSNSNSAGGGGAIPQTPSWDLPVRAACALALVLALTTAAGWLGPQLSGLLAPFPVITTVLATFTHSQRGADEAVRLLRGMLTPRARARAPRWLGDEAVRLLRGMLTGFVAFALFCFMLTVSLAGATIAATFALATAVALAAQALMFSLAKHRSIRLVPPITTSVDSASGESEGRAA